MDDLVKDVAEYKRSLDYTQAQVDNQEKNTEEIVKMCRDARGDINKVCELTPLLDGKIDNLEARSKGNNIIIDGIPESQHESEEETENKVRRIIAEKLEMNEERIEVERARRMGDPTTAGNRHRSIIVKFLRWKDKAAVMTRVNKLRGTNIYFNEDYSEAVRIKRRELVPVMKAERAKGNIAYIRYDRLIVHSPSQRMTGSNGKIS